MSRALEQGMSWRVYRDLDSRRAALVDQAHYTPQGERTPRQERIIEDIQWQSGKAQRRMENVGIAQGRVHTSNGVAVFVAGNRR